MEKTGRKALFQAAPSDNGNTGGNEILNDWVKILKSAVEGDASARIDLDSVDGSLKPLGETLNLAIEKISTDSADIQNKKRLIGNAQKRYREIIQQNPMPMLLINKNLKIVVTNPAYEEMSGYTTNDLRTMNIRDFRVVESDGDGIKKAFSEGIRSAGEMVVDLPSGTRILEQHSIPVRNDAGEITNVLLAFQDLTDLRREMGEINLLNKKAESFIKQNPQAIAVLGPDKSRIDLNKEYERVWRGSYEELMRKKLYDFDITMTGGDDFYASYETKRLAVSDMELKWPNGDKTYVTLYQVPILDDNGDILVNYYIYQDRTAEVEEKGAIQLLQKQSESFIKQNPQAIAVLGPDKSRIDLNKEYERVWRGSYEELMAKKLYDFDITMTGGEDFYASYETKRLAVSDMELKWPNGDKTYVTLYQVPILDDNGDILVNYYIYQDRTAEVEEKGEIEQLQKKAESFIKQNPQAIAVLGPDKTRLDINKEYERVWRGSYEELMAKKLYDFDITMTGGEDFYASFETKRLAVTNMELKWPNGDKTYVTLYQVPILDDNGDILVNYYIYQDLTKDVSVEKYLNNEVEKLKANLEMFSHGDLTFNSVVDEGNEYTTVVRDNFAQINGSIDGVRDAVGSLLADVGTLAEATVEGKLDTRVDASFHSGEFAKVIGGVNDIIDAMVGPLNVTAEYVDRISKGDIPEKITDAYAGDFNEIKNNLNACIDGLGGLVEANAVLQRMADNDYTVKVEGDYVGLFADVATATNAVTERLLHLQDTAQNIAVGDLSDLGAYKAIGQRSENDRLVPSFVSMMENIEAVVDDANMLAEAGVNGQLDVRADATRHAGAYGEVISGINNTLDAMVGPLNVAAEYVDRISKGDIPEKVTDAWKGDFNEVKNNLNQCINAVNLLVADAGLLAQAGVDGRLDVRADGSKHQGDFRKIVDGVNGTLDAIGAPLQETMALLERMAVNDYTTKIENTYPGDYAKVTQNLNEVLGRLVNVQDTLQNIAAGDLSDLHDYKTLGQRSKNDKLNPSFIGMIESLQAVVDDAEMLAQAGVNGQLDVRADATRHKGAYGEVIGGINNCLDAVVGPLNVAAEYVDRIAKGDIPEKITDVYAGDFNEIKNNLNECIDAVNLLVVDTNMLVDAAAAGKLTARADVSQHAGDFAKIVGGINQTFDVINEPFREVNAAIAQLDVTADETTRGADEIAKAAEQVALTSQQCADLGNSLIIQIEEVDRQVADLSASNEEIASTSQEVHEHAVQTAEIGEKAQKLGAEANAKMTVVEDIAKQSVDGIEDLNSRMQEIDNVVKQVNDITNQINLLALNAAIEAARAGEHGRGFAVVAGEVRNLAVEAKAATGQIDQVIAGVQTISAKTAEAIGSAHTEIGSGVASVNATIGALNEIVKGSQDMKLNLDEIAKAIEDQANMANRIVEAMEESSRLTRENQGQVEELASLAEEASASTEEIGSSIYEVKNMAGDLKQTMDKFEV
jgi:methyl-accepting chemotaxis protein